MVVESEENDQLAQKHDPLDEPQPVAARTRGRARLTDAAAGPRESKVSAKSRAKGKRREKPLPLATSPPIIDVDSNVHTPISSSTTMVSKAPLCTDSLSATPFPLAVSMRMVVMRIYQQHLIVPLHLNGHKQEMS